MGWMDLASVSMAWGERFARPNKEQHVIAQTTFIFDKEFYFFFIKLLARQNRKSLSSDTPLSLNASTFI